MKTMVRRITCLMLGLYSWTTFATDASTWLTRFERSGGLETARYQESMYYWSRLAQSSPAARWLEFGVSPEGRSLRMLVISQDRCFTPEKARRTGKPVVLIQGCIHPGESEGNDAGMLIARDLLVDKRHAKLIDRLILLFVPIFNVDGHERYSWNSRINQNGPAETGWRVTATRLNLNRDFVKADAPEMRAWLAMYHAWNPHFFYDCHTTDGQDFQYVLNYYIDTHPDYGGPISRWAADRFLHRLLRRAEQEGLVIGPYAGLVDERDPAKGMMGGVWRPMLSNSFATLMNRAGFLIEAHSLKPYKQRVEATRDLLLMGLDLIADDADELMKAVAQGDRWSTGLGKTYDPQPSFPLAFRTLKDKGDSMVYRGYHVRYVKGEISGEEYPIYSQEIKNTPSLYLDRVEPSVLVSPPLGYLVPAAWQNVVQVLDSHGISYVRLKQTVHVQVETYRFTDVKFRSTPYEGRQLVSFKTNPVSLQRTFQAGDLYVPLNNYKSRLIMYLLEPASTDALICWGFFNTIFEDREYFEEYVMEPLAQTMLKSQPAIKKEFNERLATDSSFAASPRQRLYFFYERSPFFDAEKNLYPIARVIRRQEAAIF